MSSRFASALLITSLPVWALHCGSDDSSNPSGTSGSLGAPGGAPSAGSAGKGGTSSGGGAGVFGAAGTLPSGGSGGSGNAGTSSGVSGGGAAGSATAGSGGSRAGSGGSPSAGNGGAGAGRGGTAPSGGGGTGGTAGGASGGQPSTGAFALKSSALTEGATFKAENTCDIEKSGGGQPSNFGKSPPLTWTPGPSGTESYAIVLEDLDADYHWAIWDIPATVTELPAALPGGATLTTPVAAKQRAAFGQNSAYVGPCPPNEHDYRFTLYALDTATLTVQGNNVAAVDTAAQAADLASATLTGKYARQQ